LHIERRELGLRIRTSLAATSIRNVRVFRNVFRAGWSDPEFGIELVLNEDVPAVRLVPAFLVTELEAQRAADHWRAKVEASRAFPPPPPPLLLPPRFTRARTPDLLDARWDWRR